MKYFLVIFDMDGTILDTLNDLCDSLNYALSVHGYPERTLAEVKSFVGNGVRRLVELGVPMGADCASVDDVFSVFCARYKLHSADKTKPYEGIKEVLARLKESGLKLAVVSNKPDDAVKELCKEYFCGLFDFSVGEKAGVKRKPAPDEIEEVLKHFSATKEDAVYIGDSEVDLATARNSGLPCVSVTWGFREREFLLSIGATTIVSSPAELSELLLP